MKIDKTVDIEKKFLIHDIEVLKNWFSDVFLFPKKNKLLIMMLWDKEIPDFVYDSIREKLPKYEITFLSFEEMVKFLDAFDPILIGYNSYNFDDNLITTAIDSFPNFLRNDQFLEFLHKEASVLIKSDVRTKKRYSGIDLMRVSGLDRIFKPLKQTAANLRHGIIKDFPKKPEDSVELDDIVDLVVYEVNDCLIPEKMLYGIPKEHNSPTVPKTAYEGLLPAIKFRVDMGDHYDVNLMNSNKSQIGEKLAVKLYSKASGREPKEFRNKQTERKIISYDNVIFDVVKFKTKELQKFLSDLKKLNYRPDGNKKHKEQFAFELDLFNLKISFGQGGLHCEHQKLKKFTISNLLKIKDLDVGSYYPSLYWKYFIEPEHLPHFNDFVGDLITTRLKFKHEGKKVFANGLKIAINRIKE
jgi:hypothetical protein